MVYMLIDLDRLDGLVFPELLTFKVCAIIGISKIVFFNFSSTERVTKTSSTCFKKSWRVKERQKSISAGQMTNYSFSLKPYWILKASVSFKEKVGN